MNKVKNALKGSKFVSSITCLFIFRLIVTTYYAIVFIHDSIHAVRKYHFFSLQYFTTWGVWLTTIYFTYATVNHLRYWKREETLTDSSSPWCAWKWVSSLFMTAMLWECVIASVYWSILYWPDRDYLKAHPVDELWNFSDHLVPICVLWIDWSLNRVFFEFNQIYVNMVIFLLYGTVNIGVTYGRGYPVYDPISWDSVGSWILGLAMLPLAAGYYTGIYYLTRFKFKKMGMHDSIEYSVATDTKVDSLASDDRCAAGPSGDTSDYNHNFDISPQNTILINPSPTETVGSP